MKVISLGWGVQSFALAAMSALGELPPVDVAIHADTTHERSETYAFAAKWTPWLADHGLTVITVSDHKAVRAFYGNNHQTHLPVFTRKLQAVHHHEGKTILWRRTNQHGQLRRSCTQRWKIAPQRRAISWLLEWQGLKKEPGVVEQWFGITRDEWTRMRDSDVQYVTNTYPFMQMFDPPMTRHQVTRWLLDNGLEVPLKSACVFCPYHNLDQWREVRDTGNGDWTKTLEVDRQIRHKRPGYLSFIHPDRVPLDEVDLRDETDHGQLELWPADECTGNCFL